MAIKLYWCRGEGRADSSKRNFGDYLSPLIVEMISREKVEYSPIKSADMISLGTILGKEVKSKRFIFFLDRFMSGVVVLGSPVRLSLHIITITRFVVKRPMII